MGCGTSKAQPPTRVAAVTASSSASASASAAPQDKLGKRRDSVRRVGVSAETTSETQEQITRGGVVRRNPIDAGDAPSDESFRELNGKPCTDKSPEVTARIAAATVNNPLFAGMEEAQRTEIYTSMVEIPVEAGQQVGGC